MRAFDQRGRYLYTVARRGEGPGEVQGPCCLAFANDGSLWVRDTGNARYASFRLNADGAELERNVLIQHMAAGLFANTTFIGDTLVDVGARSDPELGSVRERYFVVQGEGVVGSEPVPEPTLEELGGAEVRTELNGMQVIYFFHRPFGPSTISAHGPDGVWVDGVTDRYELRIHRRDGSSVVVTGPTFEGPTLSEEERGRAARRIESDKRRAGGSAGQITWGVPERKQPLEDAYFASDGRLWVEITTPDGEDRLADIYTAEGELVERRTWPGRVRLGLYGWAGTDSALGVATDSLGVQRVARVDWDPTRF